jgi:hypothetical protein
MPSGGVSVLVDIKRFFEVTVRILKNFPYGTAP